MTNTLYRDHDIGHISGEEFDHLQRAGHGEHQLLQHCLQGCDHLTGDRPTSSIRQEI